MPSPTQIESFAAVSVAWDSLLARSRHQSVFLTWAWQRAWWEVFGQEEALRLVPIRVDGVIVGLAPLQYSDHVLTFLGDTDLFDYHDFVYSEDVEAIFFPALVDYLEEQDWPSLDLSSLPGDSVTLEHLPTLLRRRGYKVMVEKEDVAPGISLTGTWDEYLAGLRKKDRHELRRKLRRLDTSGPIHYVHAPPEDIPVLVDDFLALMRASDDQKNRFLTPQREIFFRHFFSEMAALGSLKLWFLDVEGERVSSAVGFDHAGTRYLYNSGYNPVYKRLSVGLLLKALCVKDAIEQGLRYFDLLRGAESYKYHLGARDVILYRVCARRQ